MNCRWRASALAFLAGLGLALGGCSQSPLAPDSVSPGSTAGGSATPPIVSFAPDGSVDYVPASVATTVGVEPLLSGTLPRSVSSSVKIDGAKGGFVRAGRFSVKLPAGAFAGSATVTVSVADTTVMICDLTIMPQTANRFKYPAHLTADLSGTTADVATLTTYWYDPTRLLWVSLGGKSVVSGTTVITSLDHFSKYAAGKAGW